MSDIDKEKRLVPGAWADCMVKGCQYGAAQANAEQAWAAAGLAADEIARHKELYNCQTSELVEAWAEIARLQRELEHIKCPSA